MSVIIIIIIIIIKEPVSIKTDILFFVDINLKT